MRKLTTTAIATLLAPLSLWAGPAEMTFEEARHLIARTGFGAAPDEIARFIGMSYADGVDQILDGVQGTPTNPMPEWVNGWAYPHDQIWALGQTRTDLYFNNRYHDMRSLQKWWLREMIETPSPLTEKLVLFWHDHFATSADEHERPQWAGLQNQMFRTHAAGNFADLAEGILQDPGMLYFLTNTENRAAAPNENLAREFLELFTLGEGRGYDETDVVEAARALTGHTINTQGGDAYVFDHIVHDHGIKTILGNTGRHNADDLPRIVLDHPSFGPFVVERLWRAFVSHTPDPDEVTRLAAIWRAADWELKPLLRAMFLSDAFWDPANRGTIVKSPVELMVGSLRTFGTPLPYLDDLLWAVEDLGQELFFPPNVGGWPEGTGWINDATASSRATMLHQLLQYDPDPREDSGGMMMSMQGTAASEPMADLQPDDLAVGQVFVTGAESFGGGAGHLGVTLFDLTFQGKHWRSLPLALSVRGPHDFNISMQTSDCPDFCLPGFPDRYQDAFGWVWFDANNVREGHTDWITEDDALLLATIFGHLPAILAAAPDQHHWSETAQAEGSMPLDDAIIGAGWLADFAQTHFGTPKGEVYVATTPPAAVGLTSPDITGMSREEAIEYMEEYHAQIAPGATPAYIYPDAGTWLAAVPLGGFDSKRAEAALLAAPLPAEGQRMEKTASDPEALLRAIVMSPHFQLN